MPKIADLLRQHASQEAWVFGKGPSLNLFDFEIAGPLRLCINESVLVVPNASYFFAHDELPIQRAAEAWPPHCRAILQPVRAQFAIRHGIPEDFIFTYEKCERELEILDWPPDKVAQKSSLIGLTGTVHSAIHFCSLIGVSSVVFVGMDGKGGYADCFGIAPQGGGQHDVIRRDSITILNRLGLEYQFYDSSTGQLGECANKSRTG